MEPDYAFAGSVFGGCDAFAGFGLPSGALPNDAFEGAPLSFEAPSVGQRPGAASWLDATGLEKAAAPAMDEAQGAADGSDRPPEPEGPRPPAAPAPPPLRDAPEELVQLHMQPPVPPPDHKIRRIEVPDVAEGTPVERAPPSLYGGPSAGCGGASVYDGAMEDLSGICSRIPAVNSLSNSLLLTCK